MLLANISLAENEKRETTGCFTWPDGSRYEVCLFMPVPFCAKRCLIVLQGDWQNDCEHGRGYKVFCRCSAGTSCYPPFASVLIMRACFTLPLFRSGPMARHSKVSSGRASSMATASTDGAAGAPTRECGRTTSATVRARHLPLNLRGHGLLVCVWFFRRQLTRLLFLSASFCFFPGRGCNVWSQKDMYLGDWVNDERHGYGIYIWADERVYKGARLALASLLRSFLFLFDMPRILLVSVGTVVFCLAFLTVNVSLPHPFVAVLFSFPSCRLSHLLR